MSDEMEGGSEARGPNDLRGGEGGDALSSGTPDVSKSTESNFDPVAHVDQEAQAAPRPKGAGSGPILRESRVSRSAGSDVSGLHVGGVSNSSFPNSETPHEDDADDDLFDAPDFDASESEGVDAPEPSAEAPRISGDRPSADAPMFQTPTRHRSDPKAGEESKKTRDVSDLGGSDSDDLPSSASGFDGIRHSDDGIGVRDYTAPSDEAVKPEGSEGKAEKPSISSPVAGEPSDDTRKVENRLHDKDAAKDKRNLESGEIGAPVGAYESPQSGVYAGRKGLDGKRRSPLERVHDHDASGERINSSKTDLSDDQKHHGKAHQHHGLRRGADKVLHGVEAFTGATEHHPENEHHGHGPLSELGKLRHKGENIGERILGEDPAGKKSLDAMKGKKDMTGSNAVSSGHRKKGELAAAAGPAGALLGGHDEKAPTGSKEGAFARGGSSAPDKGRGRDKFDFLTSGGHSGKASLSIRMQQIGGRIRGFMRHPARKAMALGLAIMMFMFTTLTGAIIAIHNVQTGSSDVQALNSCGTDGSGDDSTTTVTAGKKNSSSSSSSKSGSKSGSPSPSKSGKSGSPSSSPSKSESKSSSPSSSSDPSKSSSSSAAPQGKAVEFGRFAAPMDPPGGSPEEYGTPSKIEVSGSIDKSQVKMQGSTGGTNVHVVKTQNWSYPGFGNVGNIQLNNAALLLSLVEEDAPADVKSDKNLLTRLQVMTLMAALDESTLMDLDHGDRASHGLFQQQYTTGWGTIEQTEDPIFATKSFLGVNPEIHAPGLLSNKRIDWKHGDMNDIVQSTQQSGTPEAYAKFQKVAVAMMKAMGKTVSLSGSDPSGGGDGSDGNGDPCGAGSNGQGGGGSGESAWVGNVSPSQYGDAIVHYGHAQNGLHYVWGGGAGSQPPAPDGGTHGYPHPGLDCEGLVRFAYYYGTGGFYNIPGGTSAQYPDKNLAKVGESNPNDSAGQKALLAKMKPGDAIYYSTGAQGNTHHTAIYIGNGKVDQESHPGKPSGDTEGMIMLDNYWSVRRPPSGDADKGDGTGGTNVKKGQKQPTPPADATPAHGKDDGIFGIGP